MPIGTPLEGKVALVTGAAQGLGEAAAIALGERGARVLVTDFDAETGAAATASMVAKGIDATFQRLDVSSESEWKEAVATAMRLYGKVDTLVNNAALIDVDHIDNMSVERFDRNMAVNVRGVFLGCKHIWPAMKAAGGGSIINISSIAGIVATATHQTAYATSKGAVRLLTKAVARDYVDRNIRVNSVHPGAMKTPAVNLLLQDEERAPLVMGRTPMDRISDPGEVAAVIAFLASDDSSYMTGSELVVDGGWLAS